MTRRFRLPLIAAIAALGLITMLGGCVVYPAYGYHYPQPYYGGVYYGGGWRR